MHTITDKQRNEYIIKKSHFLGFIDYVDSLESAEHILDKLHKEFTDASHIVYAFRLADNTYKFSDANEPRNSAGKPLYNVLEKNDLYNVIISVIRYFGGIKLGIGGLVRAYTHTGTDLLSSVKLRKLEKGFIMNITTDYKKHGELIRYLNNNPQVSVLSEDFKEKIYVRIAVSRKEMERMKKLNSAYSIDVLKETYLAF